MSLERQKGDLCCLNPACGKLLAKEFAGRQVVIKCSRCGQTSKFEAVPVGLTAAR